MELLVKMMKYRVILESEFEEAPRSEAEEQSVLAFLERVLDHLEATGAEDADAGGSMTTGQVHVSVVVAASDSQTGFQRGTQLIRQAIEAAGVKVEDWSRERFVVEPEGSPEPLALVAG